jgi:hypothetical protein
MVNFSANQTANTLFSIQDASGTNLVLLKPARTYSSILFSAPTLKSGSTYSIYTGGTTTGTNTDGLITGGTYSGGILKKSFTVSSSSKINKVSL